MYLVSEEEEGIYLQKRLSTIKVAIEEVLFPIPVPSLEHSFHVVIGH